MRKDATLKQFDNGLPDYDYLFQEELDSKNKKKKKQTNILGKIMRINIVPIILSIFIYIFQSLPIYITPLLTAEIINIVTKIVELKQGVPDDKLYTILFYFGIIVVTTIINVPLTISRYKVVSKVIRRTGAGIKASVVRKLQSLALTYHKDLQTGKVQTKFIKNTEEVDMFLSAFLQQIIPTIVSLIIYLAISVGKNPIISLFFVIMVPANVFLSFAFRKKIRKSHHDFRVNNEHMSNKLHTMLEMMPVTKAHGLEMTERKMVEDSIKKVQGAGLNVDMTVANFGAWSWVIHALISAIVLLFTSLLAAYGHITVGEIVLFQSLFSSLSSYLSSIVNQLPIIGKGAEAFASISEIMHVNEVEVSIGKRKVENIEGEVQFKNVGYVYPRTTQKVINNFSLNVKKGECIAVVGSSGSGKSTLMNMIIGFLPPTEGDILIDGKSIKDFNLSDYRSHLSVVPQSSILFSGTIKENITYGIDHYTEEQLEKVLEMANLNEFIKEFPDGINTQVGERGEKLSGGQRQRVTIARALIRDPKILIFDEATSALDNISEYNVQKAIASSVVGRTTFIVAHRLSTIRDADRIVVLENGEAVEIGTFTELMEKKGKFYELKKLSELTDKKAKEGLE